MTSMSEYFASAQELNSAALESIAGGVVSLNRKVEPQHIFCKAKGSRIWDIEGNEYIDYHAAFSPHLLGHNDPTVNSAVAAAMEAGWSLTGSGPTPWEVCLAGMLQQAMPSLELLQVTNTGSEGTSLAIRLAQAHTRRYDTVLMLGGYNGWQDSVARVVMPSLKIIGPRISAGEYPFLPASSGILPEIGERIHIVNFNDLDSLEYVLSKYDVACVLTEPVLQNVGVILPEEGYLSGLVDLCRKHGAVSIFDEVKTGFRSALGGYQSVAGVTPDLTVLGKAVANGFPMAVVGGRRDIMQLVDDPAPERRVLIAGTYNAHPVACAASIATIQKLKENETYERIDKVSERLYEGLESLFEEYGVSASVVRNRSAFCIYFCDKPPRDWHDVLEHHDFAFDLQFRKELINRGVYQIPIACKQGSVSLAHSVEDIDFTLQAVREVLSLLPTPKTPSSH